ncbi:MAG: hypothetical protein H9855_06050 [Candidatus Acinetobacter avistercoris]|uniref:putative four-helix membrane protein n=1 Tax=Acinetobacter sp. KS-LM10 TaxID=3120518 RepID=UPI001FA233D7|nr:hypothetical protein [Candidatus Acinetobacter avistercoris]
MINKIIVYTLLLTTSFHCIALPLGTLSNTSGGTLGSSSPSLLILLVGTLAFYLYYKIFMDWMSRKRNQIKPELRVGIQAWLLTVIIFAFISLFASSLIFLMLDAIWGEELIRSIGLYVWLVLFIILLFLAMT